MAVAQYFYGGTNPTIATVATAQAVAVGDICAMTSNTITRAQDEAWNTDLATTQTAFVLKFLGVSGQQKDATLPRVFGNASDNVIRIDAGGVFQFDCASATFEVGDLVGCAKQTGNFLESQKVVGVATEALAIGRVIERGTSITRVKVQILSKLNPIARQS
jgi:hypothetical protein